jgi:hypothetical protein
MTITENPTATVTLDRERTDLLQTLAQHRWFLVNTAQGLTEEQARTRSTASELTVGGLIKHVAAAEAQWAAFIVQGTGAVAAVAADGTMDPAVAAAWSAEFRLDEDETLAGVIEHYQQVAARTDELIATLPTLDDEHPLPPAPWFPPGASWSFRRVLQHVLAETAQHAGHADIIRESIDGQKSMG